MSIEMNWHNIINLFSLQIKSKDWKLINPFSLLTSQGITFAPNKLAQKSRHIGCAGTTTVDFSFTPSASKLDEGLRFQNYIKQLH